MAAIGIWDQELLRQAMTHFATGNPATGAAELGRRPTGIQAAGIAPFRGKRRDLGLYRNSHFLVHGKKDITIIPPTFANNGKGFIRLQIRIRTYYSGAKQILIKKLG